ncbi:GNAT family N-acetyltransferase [Pseudonocardia benzenivorans]
MAVVDDHVHVARLVVVPAARRAGTGTALMAAAARWGLARGRAGWSCRCRRRTPAAWRSGPGSAPPSTTATTTSCRDEPIRRAAPASGAPASRPA